MSALPEKEKNMNKQMNTGLVKKLGAGFLFFTVTLSIACAEELEPSATPYRPTITNPADLSAPGWLELEAGLQRIEGGSDKQRDSVPLLFKLAFSEDWGILVGGETGVRRTDLSNEVFSGNGDTTFLIKHRISAATEGTAWGVEAGYKAPTAPDTIGSGKSDAIVSAIYSTDIGRHHLDLNLSATQLGAYADGEGSIQYGWAAGVSHVLNDRFGAFAELSGVSRSAVATQAQMMAGASYNLSKRVVLDAGASWGLNKASQEWTVFAGVTTLLGRLW